MQEGTGLKANVIEESGLRVEIEECFAEPSRGVNRVTRIRYSRKMINILQTHNRVLCPYNPGLNGFIRRTFLEYLCAAQPLRSFEKDRNLIIEKSTAPMYFAIARTMWGMRSSI